MGDFALKRQALWCEIRFFLILVVAAAMLTGCAAGESNSLFTEGLAYDEADHTWTTEEESFEKLVKIMRQECAYPDTASGVYLLATDDHVIFLCGVNSVETDGKTRVNAYTVFEIGSITKTFTATAILQLCEQGKLDLDDPLGNISRNMKKARELQFASCCTCSPDSGGNSFRMKRWRKILFL